MDEEDERPTGAQKGKGKERVKVTNACDCRKNKRKCTRDSAPDISLIQGIEAELGPCNLCLKDGVECTYTEEKKRRYIESVETRLVQMETMLRGILQNGDPKARSLLSELIGDEETLNLLASSPTVGTGSSALKPPTAASKRNTTSAYQNLLSNQSYEYFYPTPSASGVGGEGSSEGKEKSVKRTKATPAPKPVSSLSLFPTSALVSASLDAISPSIHARKKKGAKSAGGGKTDMPHVSASDRDEDADAEESSDEVSEFADVFGQLSVNEAGEVGYHGKPSGLYLLKKERRIGGRRVTEGANSSESAVGENGPKEGFFWNFQSNTPRKSENEILGPPPSDYIRTSSEIEPSLRSDTQIGSHLPSREVQQPLLELYWRYVQPHFPILYKPSFLEKYAAETVPLVLLFSMLSLSVHYTHDEELRTLGQEWKAKAKTLVDADYGTSRLVNIQALLLMGYRESGRGEISQAWLYTGMAARMAQDLGLFRDVEKWHVPPSTFSHADKQARKRAWWGCIILDRYTASYIGRPGTIHERDFDTSFPSTLEIDETEAWEPLDPVDRYTSRPSNAITCFRASGSLAIIVNQIIATLYAIRTRIQGQSSDTLLSFLDQRLARWFLDLPECLQYNEGQEIVPPPHVRVLFGNPLSQVGTHHIPPRQVFALHLHIPGRKHGVDFASFPSHAICTAAAHSVANLVTTFQSTFTLRRCPPFLTYSIFSAAVLCVYNASFDISLATQAKQCFAQCVAALREMGSTWESASRQLDLLSGVLDVDNLDAGTPMRSSTATHGVKRSAEDEGDSFETDLESSAQDEDYPTSFFSNFTGAAAGRGDHDFFAGTGLLPDLFGDVVGSGQWTGMTVDAQAQPPEDGPSPPPWLHLGG
ncbi:hypothetical protein T439DRAFT_327189 [Meredithblackwellia eburnea MCA 4105]